MYCNISIPSHKTVPLTNQNSLSGLAKQNGRFVPLTKKDIARRASVVAATKPTATSIAAGDGENNKELAANNRTLLRVGLKRKLMCSRLIKYI